MHAPLWQVVVHQVPKAITVMPFYQMDHFVHQDVFEAGRRFLRQFEVQPDSAGVLVAGSPGSLHLPDAYLCNVLSDLGSPFLHELGQAGAELAAVPVIHDRFSLVPICAGADSQRHSGVVEQSDSRWSVALGDVEPVASAFEVVALAGHELPLGLAMLLFEFCLLSANPSQA